MNLPIEIKNIIESLSNKFSFNDLRKTSSLISEMYLKNDGKTNLVCSELEVITYAIVRMPATFGAISSSLKWTMDLINDDVNSVIDIGSGTGSSILAALYLLNNCSSFVGYEKENEMIKFSKQIIQNANVSFIHCDVLNMQIDNHADLITCSYMINEIDESKLFPFLDSICNKFDKYLLITEPGTPKSYQRLMLVRDYLLAKGYYLIAPCTHNKKCPIKSDDWCQFVTRIARSKLHKALKNGDSPFEDEKFSFIAFSKVKRNLPKCRILRHPIVEKNQICFQCCVNDGNINQIKISKSNNSFKKTKKLNCGDVLEYF